jgi:hypothetical protein
METIDLATQHIRLCERCGVPYDWRRSGSTSLKMTYCNSICEASDLGFTIEAIIRTEFSHSGRREREEERELVFAA